ncbi:MAG TPA: cellulase family glycosylhydrolase [Prolixibacteraceae bacterium]|nr:cellulase family glycosylhydrolase [Prolixibacteraceae bacterium]
MKRFLSLPFMLVAMFIGLISCQQPVQKKTLNPSGFAISRGVNLSHWLSQDFGWAPKYSYINESDLRFIDSIGYDHVRIPVDEIELWNEAGEPVDEAFRYLHDCLGWCKKYGLKAIVDLHTIRAHHFNAENEGGENTLWTNPAEQDKFVQLWMYLSDELKQYPVDEVAYELMNEAVAPDHDDWNKLFAKAIAAIREREPDRVLVIGSNMWQIAPNLPLLKLPEGDRNIILSFHTYSPMLLTHFKAGWTQLKNYSGQVTYPGPIINEEDFRANVDSSNASTLQFYKEALESWGPGRLLEGFKMAIDFARANNLQLYCGEFGCMPTVPREARLAYYTDLIDVLEENEVAWCNWEYKGDFGLYFWDYETLQAGAPDGELIGALLHKIR